MDEKKTEDLMDLLKKAEVVDLTAMHRDLTVDAFSFPSYMDGLIAAKGLKRQDIFVKADIDDRYGYKLLSGEKRTTDRDKLLRLFFAMGLTLDQCQKALELYGMLVLYPKVERDAVFIIAFSKGIDDVDTVDRWLIQRHQAPLSVGRQR